MTYFILGWLAVLSVAIGALWNRSQLTKGTTEIWRTDPPSKNVLSHIFPDSQPKAEFLPSTRVQEIIEGKKDVSLADIIEN